MGSDSFFRVLQREGAATDISGYVAESQKHARIYQAQSKRYWLYQ